MARIDISIVEENLNRIITKVVEERADIHMAQVINFLDKSEQIAALSIILGVNIDINELPQMQNSEHYYGFEVIDYNPIKDKLIIQYSSDYEKVWKVDNKVGNYVFEKSENTQTFTDSISYDTYMLRIKEGWER